METIIPPPDMESESKKQLVIGCFPAPLAFGDEFHIADVRFFEGNLLRKLFNALVYTGDKLSIGGREFIREKGDEFWIVRFGAEEFEFNRLVHGSPNVKLRGAPLLARPA